jgi:hypothetical protein
MQRGTPLRVRLKTTHCSSRREQVATHQEARAAMRNRRRKLKKSMGWYRQTQHAFAALPDD